MKLTEKTIKTLRQKTLKNYFDYLDPVFEVGEEVVLVECYDERTGCTSWDIRRAPQGIGGNLDPQAKRFHGWRGTTDGISITAHGLRRVIKVMTALSRKPGTWTSTPTPRNRLNDSKKGGLETMDPITLEFIGCDRCGRPVYEHDGRLYVDTDPRQHVAPKLCTKYRNTFDGEPDTPIDPQVQVSFIPHRITWGIK